MRTVTSVEVAAVRPGWSGRQRDSAIAVLERHRARWLTARPSLYRYRQEGACFCTQFWSGPRIITVAGGRVVSATDATGTRTDSAFVRAGSSQAGGIDALFDRVARSVQDSAVDQVRVDYDEARGFPTRILFDPSLLVNDDEYTLTISHVESLKVRRAAPHSEAPTTSGDRRSGGG